MLIQKANVVAVMAMAFATITVDCVLPGEARAGTKVEKSKEALSDIHERIESLKKELNIAQEAHADATDALKASEKSISETNRKLYELNQQHKENRSKLENLQEQKSGIETTLQEQKQLLGSQLYQQYLHGQQSYIQVVLQQQDPGAMARQLQYFSYVSKARARLIAAMQSNLGKIVRLNDETAQALKAITELKVAQEQERRELQSQKNERSKVLKKLASQINAQRGEIDKLKRDEKNLSQLVEKLVRAAQQKLAQQQAQQKQQSKQNKANKNNATSSEQNSTSNQTQSSQPLARNDTLPTNAFDGGNFAALRGKLNLPVRGDITNRFGAAREDTGVSWKGLFIKSSEGSEVKSVASGRVVFADWMRGFGNLLIIDHGDGYMSLYGNNQALLRKVGDTVKGGDTVAAVGNSGGNEASGLYYELRKQSKPFDPMSWSVFK
ncbi:MAG TPA: peptidoglycan DD-metalloendopeptidase family protein [Methylophilaceae bacterium]|nr:peptidoglycan DD-metalloendopeptidase family protein [Methylophilaceae bacterium]